MILLLLFLNSLFAQLYFPTSNESWETISPAELNWCVEYESELDNFLDTTDTKAFIILKDGKLAYEKYFNGFARDSVWYWASAAKSLTSVLVGIAQENNKLQITDKTSKYLGENWTALDKEKEDLITIYHQLSMTTGLDESTNPNEDKSPDKLTYKADAGNRWYYYNVPYLLLHDVLEKAYNQNINIITNQVLKNKIGMQGLWFDNLFISKALDAARFGLLIMNDGVWKEEKIYNKDLSYYSEMINSSQSLNPAYGYLWWLNGKDNYLQPGIEFEFQGPIIPSAPKNMFMAAGKNDQRIYIDRSNGLVIVRFGDPGDEVALAISGYDEKLWQKVNNLICNTTKVENLPTSYHFENDLIIFNSKVEYVIYDLQGRILDYGNSTYLDTRRYKGMYLLKVSDNSNTYLIKVISKY